jgi:GNAT superfamily N-acetyltransferase
VLQDIADAQQAEDRDLPELARTQANALFGDMVRLREYLKINDPDSLDETDQWIGGVLKAYEHLLPEDGMPPGLEEVQDKIPKDPGLFGQSLNWAMAAVPLAHPMLQSLELIDRPAQGVQTALALALADDEDRSAQMLAAIGRGVTFQSQADDFYGVDIDSNDDGSINFMEILGADAEAGKDPDFGDFWGSGVLETTAGYGVGALDTIGLALTDPTIWIGFGAANKTKAGLEAVARTFGGRQGDDIARLVARKGLKVLPLEMQQRVYQTLEAALEAAKAGGRRGRRTTALVGRRMDPAEEAMDTLTQVSRPTGRISVGGVNYRTPVDALLDRNPLRRNVRGINSFAAGERAIIEAVPNAEGAFDAADVASQMNLQKTVFDQQDNAARAILANIPDGQAAGVLEELNSATRFYDSGGGTRTVALWDGVGPERTLKGTLTYSETDGAITGLFVDPKYRGQRLADELYDELTDKVFDGDVQRMLNATRGGSMTDAGRAARTGWIGRRAPELLEDTVDMNVGRRGVARAVGDTDVGQNIVQRASAFKPRLRIRQALGINIEKLADDLRARGNAEAATLFDAMSVRLTGASERAIRQLQGFTGKIPGLRRIGSENARETVDRWVREALEGASLERTLEGPRIGTDPNAVRVINNLRAEGLDDVADYVRVAVDVRREIDEAALKAGIDASQLRANYMPRVLTSEGQEAVLRNPELADKLAYSQSAQVAAQEMRFQQPRQFRPDLTIDQANVELARISKLPPGTKIFEDDVLTLFATRGRSAFAAASQVEALNGLTRQVIDGHPLAIWDDGADAAARASKLNYVPTDTPNGRIFMPEEITEEFGQLRDWVTTDKNLADMNEFINNWTKTWGAWATAPLIDGIGFHSRNAQGNIMLNALRGVTNPRHYIRAMGLQRKVGRVVSHMSDTGDSLDDALRAVVKDRGDQALLRTLMDNDIIDSGFFKDFSIDPDASRVWRLLGDNKIISSGRDIGNAVENNARIAHFVAKLDAPGGTIESAARSVRETLFDYSDLTPVERRLRTMPSRFYTFMRKNLGAQLWGLAHYPGRVAQIQQTIGQSGGLGTVLGVQQPDYSVENASTLSNVLGSDRSVSGIDSPFLAAMDVLSPIYELANLTPGIQDALPGDGDRERFVRSLYNLTSGGPVALAEMVFEQLQEKDVFLGTDLDEQGSESVWNDFVDAIIGPAWSQLDTFLARFGQTPLAEGTPLEGGVGPLGNNPSKREIDIGDELIILSNILGLNVAPYGEEQAINGLFALNEELSAKLERLDAPTLQQLRDAGIVPPPPPHESRLGSEVTQEKIEAARADGLPTDLLEQQLQERLADEAARFTRQDPETGEITNRTQRLASFALGVGLTTPSGEGSTRALAKVLFNQANIGEVFLDEDGTPLDEDDVPIVWPVQKSEVQEWAERVGAPLTDAGNVGTKTIAAWNATNPDNPYYGSSQDWAEAGVLPTEGVYKWTDDSGEQHEARSEIMTSGTSSLLRPGS